MKTKNETDSLKELITTLKKKRDYESEMVKYQLHEVCESLKPSNLLKNAFHEVTHSPEIKNNLTNNAIGLGTGFIFKKLLVGTSHNLGKKILGTLIQIGVTGIVAKHLDEFKLIGKHLFNQVSESFIVKKDSRKNEFPI